MAAMNRYNDACERWPERVFDFTQCGNKVYVDAYTVYNGCQYLDDGNVYYYLYGTETDEQREVLAFVDGVIDF